jgi:hypothetical protein
VPFGPFCTVFGKIWSAYSLWLPHRGFSLNMTRLSSRCLAKAIEFLRNPFETYIYIAFSWHRPTMISLAPCRFLSILCTSFQGLPVVRNVMKWRQIVSWAGSGFPSHVSSYCRCPFSHCSILRQKRISRREGLHVRSPEWVCAIGPWGGCPAAMICYWKDITSIWPIWPLSLWPMIHLLPVFDRCNPCKLHISKW